ncbi:rsbT co-antagonist protein RsbR [Nannocystis exedens]|uniref:RsbT co-antagonist protein RsbR n=1 Tax=Nannocystis exedens TaxID=54 RepID=A0A1I2CXA5_9BACT|nr:PAS domain-containing protein [Nannocystis exedens]PCC68637.1 RsbT co-antagonist protein RsbRA [Nannocystis exedens]SFE72825.1 rsbT co-antagonist protein RsbR [Nannocystis exedens]
MDGRSKRAPHVVIEVDEALRVTGWSRRAEQVFAATEAEALGRALAEVVPPVAGDWAALLAGDSEAPRVQAVRRGGEVLQFEAWWQVERDAAGRATGATIHGHDVTERVARYRRAALAEKMFEAVIENLDVSVWALDRDGTYLFQDGKGMQAVGLAPNHFVGRNIFAAFPDHPGHGVVRRALAGEACRAEEVEVLGVPWRNWYIPVADPGDSDAAMVGISFDLRESLRREAELRAKLDLIEKQQEVIRELSTPIIEVWDGIITVPILGLVDSVRTAEIMDDLLQAVGRLRARFAILDLTGVEVVDTGTASHLIAMIRAIGLLGAEGVLTGIHPRIAQTMVSIGVDLSHVAVHARLRDALQHCIARLGEKAGAGERAGK